MDQLDGSRKNPRQNHKTLNEQLNQLVFASTQTHAPIRVATTYPNHQPS